MADQFLIFISSTDHILLDIFHGHYNFQLWLLNEMGTVFKQQQQCLILGLKEQRFQVMPQLNLISSHGAD